MTFDRKHLYLQWGGGLPGGEQWSCGLRLAGNNAGADPLGFPTHAGIASALSGYIGDAVSAFHTASVSHIGYGATLQFAKLNAVDQAGHYVDTTTIQRSYGTDTRGGGGTSSQPPNQIALCVSLTTGEARGYGHRGRFFMPLPTVRPDAATGIIATGDAGEVETSVQTYLHALNAGIITGPIGIFNVCVMSKHGAGSTHQVTGISLGRVLDTQRRRRRSVGEQYIPLAL